MIFRIRMEKLQDYIMTGYSVIRADVYLGGPYVFKTENIFETVNFGPSRAFSIVSIKKFRLNFGHNYVRTLCLIYLRQWVVLDFQSTMNNNKKKA